MSQETHPEHPLFARIYDPVMAIPERTLLEKHREYVCGGLTGDVLDIGAGTGAMFPYFEQTGDVSVTAIEPDPYMRRRAEQRTTQCDVDITVIDAGAESIPLPDNSVDAVAACFVFCTIPDVDAALDELARVLRSGGEFRFVEHVRGSGVFGCTHDLLAPGWYHAAGGCNLNRNTGKRLYQDDRFELTEFQRFESGLGRVVPIIRGRLERRRDSWFKK